MPNFDKTGPCGKGPMTGLGRGSCSKDSTSSKNPINKKGLGRPCMGRRFQKNSSRELN